MSGVVTARSLALAVPAALMAGALGAQFIGGLYPCEMCHWQRWPHYVAIVLALLAFVAPRPARGVLVALAAFAILTSGAIGVFHAGVEYHWWQGITPCSRVASHGSDALSEILNAPIVRCDAPQWTLGPISLAGFNALFSLAGGATILALLAKGRQA
ncbi:MAG: disulfide bond formation protein B [Sphingomonas sp.]|uniref:disulfide bond formation protein B n=1 Tax=Sphingomonas sp. TaxID=28214 RepID=UPI0025DDE31E|nr:disulfide bond formation protein B [Sphingomonas sp.]MBX9882919.1 disulfide bond formation protein B [Sphingomonas sp.]